MNKEGFLNSLREALSGLPQDDVEERLEFYGEMIDDLTEEGLTEEEAVAKIGPVEDIREQTVGEIPLSKLVREKVRPERSPRAWEIVLLILGFPVWFPLIIAAFAVILSLYIVIWSLVISLWAVEISLWACVLAGIVAAVYMLTVGNASLALAAFGIALAAAGLSILMFFACVAASKGAAALAGKAVKGFKRLIIGKERTK